MSRWRRFLNWLVEALIAGTHARADIYTYRMFTQKDEEQK